MRLSIAAILLLLAAAAPGLVRPGEDAYGYGELKLGMPLAEADGLRSDDRVEDCDYRDVHRCLVRSDVAFGRKAKVIAQIAERTQTIVRILIEIKDFSRKKGYPCAAVADTVVKQIGATYGAPECRSGGRICVWKLEDNIDITNARFCWTQDPSSGLITVSFAERETQEQ